MKCEYCDNEFSGCVTKCPHCGGVVANSGSQDEKQFLSNFVELSLVDRKSRVAFAVLGVFFGIVGIHDFYAGYIGRGFLHIALVILIPIVMAFYDGGMIAFLIGCMSSWVIGIFEAATVKKDGDGISFCE